MRVCYIPTLCPLASQVLRKCFSASCLSSPSHLSEIVSWILSPFLMQIVFRSAGLGSALYVHEMRSLAKDLSDLCDCRCDKINTYPTIERRQAGGCAAIAILHSAKAEKRTVDLVKNMVLVSFENGFGSQAYWAFRGRLINRSAGKRMRQIPKSDSIVKSTETSVDGW